ncbi:MAG: phenylalanine--tRNA ligase subunit beta [Actinobacteria bacterium]|uniref:Phenylalanine--tRNA ligase beta subunit n=1 Tax=freshwater metagenome TaxID=449393 RepID=A0A6J7SRY6_9ZZZZ|nr:phenylalanine--tRNA ligase subunit beta [Actinomycetota bacterium]MTA72633.1 phenylalanine--tRNA ligase subunit beta [Actinomycetota bacterium]MTB30025.1 phenylalanine--tRNA ligase subunit beta [Actinomycetota bacterium]
MRAPLSWIKEFVDIPQAITADQISDGLIRVGFEVEEIIYQGLDVTGPLKFAEVVSIEEITEYKKPIRYVGIDCGEGQTRFVICGATNFVVGDVIVAALPGAVLPGDFQISARETYGKVSDGMICSSRELGISDEHAGIMVLPKDSVVIGDDAIEGLQINDVIFDVAVNPDRGYALSIRGIAREVAGALGLAFTDPVDALRDLTFIDTGKGVSATIADPATASVFYLRTLSNFDPTATTPIWMRRRIEKMGMRSISLVVDITNYVMLELGQPLHAFDKSKIKGGLTIKRAGKTGAFTTLDGQIRTLDPDDLMVVDDEQPLALAGTMGGAFSEITESTTDIALEAVRFDPVCIAKNSRRHKLSSEASRRLERSVDPSLAQFASARFVQLLTAHSSAAHVATVIAGEPVFPARVRINPEYVSKTVGFEITPSQIAQVLRTIGCEVDEKSFEIAPPSWRPDLLHAADFAEEVARMLGYDKIPSILPPRPLHASLTSTQKRRRAVASMLASRGLAEVQSFPFTNQATIDAMGFVGERAATYKLANPMSEEFPLMRVHLVPGLIEVAQRNISRGAKDFAIFEMGSIFRSSQKLEAAISPDLAKRPDQKIIEKIFASVPNQGYHVAGLLVGKVENENWQGKSRAYNWQDAIALAQDVVSLCNLEWTIARSDLAPWHPGRCAELIVNGTVVAHAGELHPRVVAAYGLPERSVAFAVALSALPESSLVNPTTVGTMPAAVQDVALIVDARVSAAEVTTALREGAGDLLESITLFDRYDKIGDGKVSLAFTLVFRAADRTLTGEEVSAMREAATAVAGKKLGAVVRTA